MSLSEARAAFDIAPTNGLFHLYNAPRTALECQATWRMSHESLDGTQCCQSSHSVLLSSATQCCSVQPTQKNNKINIFTLGFRLFFYPAANKLRINIYLATWGTNTGIDWASSAVSL
jgi:hypothetical protein